MGPVAANRYVCALDVETSLKSPKNADRGSWGTTADVRASKYDHFFWRSVPGQLSAPTATVIDVIADLRHGGLPDGVFHSGYVFQKTPP